MNGSPKGRSVASRARPAPLALANRLRCLLASYSWPGNVRELRNVMERLVILTPDEAIRAEDVRNCLPPTSIPRSSSSSRSTPRGQAPAVGDLHDYVRRVVWIDLTPPFTW